MYGWYSEMAWPDSSIDLQLYFQAKIFEADGEAGMKAHLVLQRSDELVAGAAMWL